MELSEAPLLLILVGLAAYAVLGGADFGAGFWQLLGGRSEPARAIREHAHHSMGPVWEANHVWLIFVLVICWTAYPRAFGSIASTLSVPLFVAGLGIILRGTAYALRSGTPSRSEQRAIETVFGVSSILTPFTLGAVIGGIASGRVPVGNAEGDLWSSWLNETSITVGTIAVATAAYMAAVYLAADAVRLGRTQLAEAFRVRALVTAVVTGAIVLVGLIVVHEDARRIWDGLTNGWGLVAVLVSVAAGVLTIALVWLRRFEPARATASVAVAAIIAGWALAQRPQFLPGLTIEEAAAGRSTLIALLVSCAVGAALLVPSLVLLFGYKLRGRFDVEPALITASEGRPGPAGEPRWALRASATSLAVGAGLLFLLESTWAHVIGYLFLLAFIGFGFVALAGSAARADVSGERL